MAHRLISSLSKVGRIGKNGLLTGNFNIVAQVQPRYWEFQQFLSQSNFSHETMKGSNKLPVCKEVKNGSAPMIQDIGTAEKGETNKVVSYTLFTSPPGIIDFIDEHITQHSQQYQIATISYTLVPKSGVRSPKSWDNQDFTGWEIGQGTKLKLVLIVGLFLPCFTFTVTVVLLIISGRRPVKENYQEITFNLNVDCYLTEGAVANIFDGKWLLVQTAPGASDDSAKNLGRRVDSFGSYQNGTKTSEMNTGPKNQKVRSILSCTPYLTYATFWP